MNELENQTRFDEAYRKFAPELRGFLYRLCPQADLDDLIQETFLKVWKGEFRGQSSLKTWTYSIAYRVAMDYHRKTRWLTFWAEIPENNHRPVDLASNDVYLLKQIYKLSKKEQSIVVMYYWQDLGLEEMAHIMGLSVSAIKSSLHHTRQKLRNKLSQKKGEEK